MARRPPAPKGPRKRTANDVRRIIRDGNGLSHLPLTQIMREEKTRNRGGGIGLAPYMPPPADPAPPVTPAEPIGPVARVVEPEDGDNPPEVTGPGEESAT